MLPTNDSFEHLAVESCSSLFDQFITQRRFLANVSPATIRWYGDAAKALLPLLPPTAAQLTDAAAKKAVMSLAQRGLSARGVNNRVQALNAWLRWLHSEGHVPTLIKIPLLKVEKLLPPALTEADMRKLLAYRPDGTNERRAWTLAMLILDCGLRLDEARFLRIEDINLDSCILKGVRQGPEGAAGSI